MNTRNILYILGTLILFLGIAMLFPLLCSLYYKEGDSSSFAYSLLITFCIGALFYFLFRPVNGKISLTHKEGFLIVATGLVPCCGIRFSSLHDLRCTAPIRQCLF